MSDGNTTASIAANVIAAHGAPEPASGPPVGNGNANRLLEYFPGVAKAEVDAMTADDSSNYTKRIAAIELARADERPFVMTQQRQIRREHDANGSATAKAAREVIDLGTAFDFRPVDPAIRRGIHAREFASSINGATLDNTLPRSTATPGSREWEAETNAIIDQLIARGRSAK